MQINGRDVSSLSRDELLSLSKGELVEAMKELSAMPEIAPLQVMSAPKRNDSSIYMGNPNPADLATISRLTGQQEQAENWRIVPFLASDNFLNYDYRVWSLNTLRQMAEQYVGASLILDHDIGSAESSVGFIVGSQLFRDDTPSKDLTGASIFDEQNSAIAQREGYHWLCLKGAVEVGTPFDEAVLKRRAQGCSTGFWLYEQRMICPDCSVEHGREVEFEEVTVATDSKGKTFTRNTCPHTPLSLFNLYIWSEWRNEDDEEPNWSSYIIRDGLVNVVELSSCVSGALPATGIIRA